MLGKTESPFSPQETTIPEFGGKSQDLSEKEYRAVPIDSSSSIKDFAEDRKRYWKKYILQEKEEEEETGAITMGKLVETRLFEPETIEDKFYIADIEKLPTGKMLDFVNALFKLTVDNLDEDGACKTDFEQRVIQAREIAEYAERTKTETLLKQFEEGPGQPYFDSLLGSIGKTVVSMTELNISAHILGQLSAKFPTLNRVNDNKFIVLHQVKIWKDFSLLDIPLKGMLDRVEIDLEAHTIQPIDLKISYAVEDFFWGYYLKRKSYFQAYIYNKLLTTQQFKDLILQYIPKEHRKHMKILPFKFWVGDSTGRLQPLEYEFDEQAEIDAWEGFKIGNKTYKGLREVLTDLYWHKNNNIWDISRTNSITPTIKLSSLYGQ